MKIYSEKELSGILEKHRLWLEDDGGERADLRYANLRYADLLSANLHYANLRSANLRYADLRSANLLSANLHSADLTHAKGIYLLPVQDVRGHCFAHAIETDNGWRIRADCRDFSIEEAKTHWGESYRGNREQGDMYLYAIEWLERKLA